MNEIIYPSETSNMYLRLGIEKGADYEELKEAYRKAALYWHPDRNTDKEKSHIEFIAISEAFEILSDKLNKSNAVEDYDYEEDLDKEKIYEYYEKLFRRIFKNSNFYKKMNPELRTIIEIFRQFGM